MQFFNIGFKTIPLSSVVQLNTVNNALFQSKEQYKQSFLFSSQSKNSKIKVQLNY